MTSSWPGRASVLALLLAGPAACVERTQNDDDPQDTEAPPTTDTPVTADDTTSADSTTSVDTGDTTTSMDTAQTDPIPALSHDVHIQPIWSEHCVDDCHSPGGEWPFLTMTPGNAYASLVNVMSAQATELDYIEPGDPATSYLWHKIDGTPQEAGGGGLDMPKGRLGMEPTVLTPEQKDLIRLWIEQGAPP
ncbi:MAG: hypothetical protein KDK70_11990 [Myxococcales bacterium]|nr:hypothetical protein [Myxococcales bacterium]